MVKTTRTEEAGMRLRGYDSMHTYDLLRLWKYCTLVGCDHCRTISLLEREVILYNTINMDRYARPFEYCSTHLSPRIGSLMEL